jgi:hypothetical protein
MRGIPDKVADKVDSTLSRRSDHDGITQLIKSQGSNVREQFSEIREALRGSWNFALDGIVSKMSKNLDDQTVAINNQVHASMRELANNITQRGDTSGDSLSKTLRDFQENVQNNLHYNHEQLGGKVDGSTETIIHAIKEFTERATNQISLTSSTLSQANSLAMKEQLHNFHEAQMRNQGHITKHMEGTLAKSADVMTAEKFAMASAASGMGGGSSFNDPMAYMQSPGGGIIRRPSTGRSRNR